MTDETPNYADAPFGTYAPPKRMEVLGGLTARVSLPFVKKLMRSLTKRARPRNQHVYDITVDGLKFRVHPDRNTHCRDALLNRRFLDKDWLNVLLKGAAPDAVFVDLGANIGTHVLFGAQTLGPQARILAIEPHPRTRRCLETNIAFNAFPNIKVAPYAVGETSTTLNLLEHAINAGANSFFASPGVGNTSVEVTVRPLTDILAEQDINRIDFLKIDIEGYEDRALMPFFRTAPQELWPKRILIEHMRKDLWEENVLQWMIQHGYTVESQNTQDAILFKDDKKSINI